MNQNLNTLNKFLSDDKENILLINHISEEVDLFYFFFIRHFTETNNIKIKILESNQQTYSNNIDLFKQKIIYFSFNKTRNEDDLKIITVVPYKDFKKDKSLNRINAYNIDKDIIFLFKENKVDLEKYPQLLSYIKLNPHMAHSEMEKMIMNDNYYLNYDNKKIDKITNLRIELYKNKNTNQDIRSMYKSLKDEVDIKKFSFLIY